MPPTSSFSTSNDGSAVNAFIRACCSCDPEILELPRVIGIGVFPEQRTASAQRRPVVVHTRHFSQIGNRDFHYRLVVDVVGFNDTRARIAPRPYESAKNPGHHL